MKTEPEDRLILKQIGDPADVDRELREYRRAALVFSSKRPRLIDRFPEEWVATYRGRIRARGRTFQSVMEQVDRKRLPREHVLVRFIGKKQRTMIL